MSRASVRTALTVEMHLLLGPPTAFVILAVMPSVALGFPHALGLIANPALYRDPEMVVAVLSVPPATFALNAAWTLGIATLRDQRYAFGTGFWAAVFGSGAAAAAGVYFIGFWVLAGIAPVWAFLAHMSLLQARLHPVRAARHDTRYGPHQLLNRPR